MLLHDVGKGQPTGGHVEAGMPLVESVLERLQLGSDEREIVCFLIEQHLQISMSLLRRDIFDPATARALAESVESTERLKLLTLVTYADIKAVNPDALKAWKAQDIWYLYVETANYLDRSVDNQRWQVQTADELVTRHLKDLPDTRRAQVAQFAEGLPRRYLLTHTTETIVAHADLASGLKKFPVQLSLKIGSDLHRLTVVTPDRPGLFATVAGVLTAWGMDIVKADAFSNAAGAVLDTFSFTDPFRTLELNPPERERFKRSLTDILLGEASLQKLMTSRMRHPKPKPHSLKAPRVTLDNESSTHSTILEVLAGDRSGLLYTIASVLADIECNIEVALIDTQGHVAIDVFYVTSGGSKLDSERQQQVQTSLLEELAE
jgi:[protein-PII] uridylyltransferase